LSVDDFEAALDRVDRARTLADASTAATLDVWRAEILARAGRPDAALHAYRGLIRPDAAGAALALDGAETLLDNGHLDQARSLLDQALNLARSAGRRWIEQRAQEILDRLPGAEPHGEDPAPSRIASSSLLPEMGDERRENSE
jgi:hypothetical protein